MTIHWLATAPWPYTPSASKGSRLHAVEVVPDNAAWSAADGRALAAVCGTRPRYGWERETLFIVGRCTKCAQKLAQLTRTADLR